MSLIPSVPAVTDDTDLPADDNGGTALHDHAVLVFLACVRIPLDRFQLNELRRIELHLLAVSVVGICAALLGLKPRILGELALYLCLSALLLRSRIIHFIYHGFVG